MKPTQEQVIAWAREAGFEDYESTSLSGNSDLDETLQVGEYPIGESVFLLAALAYEAGRKDENEACADLVQANAKACDDGSLIQIYLASNAAAIRARREQ